MTLAASAISKIKAYNRSAVTVEENNALVKAVVMNELPPSAASAAKGYFSIKHAQHVEKGTFPMFPKLA